MSLLLRISDERQINKGDNNIWKEYDNSLQIKDKPYAFNIFGNFYLIIYYFNISLFKL